MDAITDNLDLYVRGLGITVQLCLWSAIAALLLGTVVAACRVSPVPVLRRAGAGWVNTLRNTPLTVVFFFVAFGLPEVGINGDFFWFAVTALALYTSTFVAESLRSGVNAVPAGQAEAARAIGLTFGQNLRFVILPQAFRTAIPPLVSTLIAMIKNSAIAGFFGVTGDLSAVGDTLTSAQGYPAAPVLLGVVIGFWILTLPAALALSLVEKKVAVLR